MTTSPPTRIAPLYSSLIAPEAGRALVAAAALVDAVIVVFPTMLVDPALEEAIGRAVVVEFPAVTEEKEGVAIELAELPTLVPVVVGEGMTGPGAVGRMEKVRVREGLKIEGNVSRLEIEVSGGAVVPCAMMGIARRTTESKNFIV